jgi:hypothetical protein
MLAQAGFIIILIGFSGTIYIAKMNYKIQIHTLEPIDEIPNYWTDKDYSSLLELFDFPDAKSIKPENLLEMLQMAITDFEPADAARVLLQYRLADKLNENQMDQMSHDMLLDKISEEYADISLHYPLYNINQLLFKAFNGTFPNIKATLLEFTVSGNDANRQFSKADLLRLLYNGLSHGNLLVRMFEEQLTTAVEFPDAESIIWELRTEDSKNFQVITSEYWLSREDIVNGEFEGVVEDEV